MPTNMNHCKHHDMAQLDLRSWVTGKTKGLLRLADLARARPAPDPRHPPAWGRGGRERGEALRAGSGPPQTICPPLLAVINHFAPLLCL